MSPAEKYTAAAYLVVFVGVLAYVGIIAAKLQRLQRDVLQRELHGHAARQGNELRLVHQSAGGARHLERGTRRGREVSPESISAVDRAEAAGRGHSSSAPAWTSPRTPRRS